MVPLVTTRSTPRLDESGGYLVHGGLLRSVGRTEGPLTPQEAVQLIIDGPTPAERRQNITTSLLRDLAVRVTGTGYVLESAGALPEVATGQLVCTIAEAWSLQRGVPAGELPVRLPDGRTTTCDDHE